MLYVKKFHNFFQFLGPLKFLSPHTSFSFACWSDGPGWRSTACDHLPREVASKPSTQQTFGDGGSSPEAPFLPVTWFHPLPCAVAHRQQSEQGSVELSSALIPKIHLFLSPRTKPREGPRCGHRH